MDRTSLIKQIQFILFDEYDENPAVLNARFYSGYYNKMSDTELLEYYNTLHGQIKTLQYN